MDKEQNQKSDTLEKFGLKIIDKLDAIPDVVMKSGIAYVGARATNHWSGALTGLIGLELAKAPNLPGSLAGVAMLAWLGLSAFSDGDVTTEPPDSIFETVTVMSQEECIASGGSIVSIMPLSNLCLCAPPPLRLEDMPPAQPPPSEYDVKPPWWLLRRSP